MYQIYKTVLCSPVDFAAEELKKYLRMMMPECGDISISYDPDATEGFRLGLMQEFGLDVSDAEDVELDDILYIEADDDGGIIAGDNPRSVLLAVYEYLRRQGCRWLFPGIDGEFVPLTEELKPVSYRHKPSCRYRGQCNEGSEFQQGMLEAIDFTPKVGMNVFMMEFRIPTSYYRRYYNHLNNEANLAPEPVSFDTILQWKRQCETELSRRGLQFHDIGHGWTADPFGMDSSLRMEDGDNEARVPAESRKFIALVDGERKLFNNTPNYTQFCMSNAEARKKVVQYAADYAQKHTNVDYLHVWLGDAVNRHCECEDCQRKIPTDWYIILLNELDEELTRRKLNTRIVFIFYTDTVWPPETEKLNNPARFTMLMAPITRSYTESVPETCERHELAPYARNRLVMPDSLEKNFSYFEQWRKMWKGANVAYEYHFWRHQYYDVGGIAIADIVHRDVRAYKRYRVNGIIQDGSQRSFFPTGFAFYSYARTLFDTSVSIEEIAEDYFTCAFGSDWRQFYEYLKELGEAFDFKYMEGQKSADRRRSPYYHPAHIENIAAAKHILEKGRALIKAHYNMPYRIQTFSVRLLEMHTKYAQLLADALEPKVCGKDSEADRLYERMKEEIGKQEIYFRTCYDQGLAFYSLDRIFGVKTNNGPDIY